MISTLSSIFVILIIGASTASASAEADDSEGAMSVIPSEVPPALIISSAYLPCAGDNGGAADKRGCADVIWDYERRIRFNLQGYLNSVNNAAYTLPLYSQLLSDIEARLQSTIAFLDPTNSTGIYSFVNDAQIAADILASQVKEILPAVQQEFVMFDTYLQYLPKQITGYNNALTQNITLSLESLITNQTWDYGNSTANMVKIFNTTQASIMANHMSFMTNFSNAITLANQAITAWQGYQTGNLSALSSKLTQVYGGITNNTAVFKDELTTKSAALKELSIESLSNVTSDNLVKLRSAFATGMSNLNSTYYEGLSNASVADAKLSAADADYAANISAQVQSIEDQFSATLLLISNQTATQQVANDVFMKQLQLNETQMLSTMNVSLTDAASASNAFSQLANETQIKGLLLTRKVLASLNDMLNSVKSAVSSQTKSFAASTGSALQSQASAVADATNAGKAAASAATGAVAGQVSDAAASAGQNTQAMVGAVAELLDAISGMSDVIKAKIGLFSDSSEASMSAVQDTMTGSANDLYNTVSQVAQAGHDQAVATQSSLLGLQTSTQEQASNLLGGFQDTLGKQLDAMNSAFTDASDQGSQTVSDASAVVQDSASAVSSLQDSASAIGSLASAASSSADSGFTQLDSIVGNTETATQQSLNQAQQAIATYIQQQATVTATDMIQLGYDTNQTFSTAFTPIRSAATKTFSDITRAFSDLTAEASTVLNGVEAAGVDFAQIVNATLAKNDSTNALMNAMVAQASARWDAILADKLADFKTVVQGSDSWTQSVIEDKIDHLQNLTGLLMGQINTQMNTVLGQLVNVSAEANITAINMLQSVSNLNASVVTVDSSAQDALTDVIALNANQTANFAALSNLTASVDANIIQQAAAMKQRIIAQNASLQAMINGIANNASAQVISDTASFVNFTTSFLASINNQREAQNDFADSQSQVRIAILNELASDIDSMRQDMLDAIMNGESQNADMANQLSIVLGEIANSQQLLASQRGASLQSVQQKLSGLMTLVKGVSGSLQTNLNAAMNRISSEAQISATKSSASQATTVAGQTNQVQGLGNSVLDMLDGVMTANSAASQELGSQQGQALEIARMVQDLGAKGSMALRKLLSAIATGQMSVKQALASATQVNTEGLDTIGSVAEAFVQVLQSFDSSTSAFVDQASSDIEIYNASALQYIDDSNTILNVVAEPLDAFATFSQGMSDTYLTNMNDAITNATAQVSSAQALQTADAQFVNGVVQDIKDKIANVSSTLASIRANETSYIQGLASEAKSTIRAAIRQMETNYLPAAASAAAPLAVDSVKWPGNSSSFLQEIRYHKYSF